MGLTHALADKYVWKYCGIANPKTICSVNGQFRRLKKLLCVVAGYADHNKSLRWRIAVAVQPVRVHAANWFGEVICRAEKVDRADFARIARQNTHLRLLGGGDRVADR